ncbi:MAG TPA: YggS family pyridoxal phosphate-dependent enzyme [Desulfomonilaceae bacterium]|nr:YggS family pyridoxal phosphate-dependent enzyme [Desulfomonilaceae bacterium]
MIADNLARILEKIRSASIRAGRDPGEVRIVAAAKGQGREKILGAIKAGIRIIGHNYLQEAMQEASFQDSADVETHMIGHLQRNKAGKAVELFQVVETVDDVRLASALDRRAGALGSVMHVMIQVNLAQEPQKSGIAEHAVEQLVCAIREMYAVRLIGLMTMPPFFDDPERARPYFARLRELRDKLIASGMLTSDMRELSMGMTGDFEAAVLEGATMVRIGTALFGPRA